MKDHTIIAYVFEDECYHEDCLDCVADLEPIFAGTEEIETITCAGCGDPLVDDFDY